MSSCAFSQQHRRRSSSSRGSLTKSYPDVYEEDCAPSSDSTTTQTDIQQSNSTNATDLTQAALKANDGESTEQNNNNTNNTETDGEQCNNNVYSNYCYSYNGQSFTGYAPQAFGSSLSLSSSSSRPSLSEADLKKLLDYQVDTSEFADTPTPPGLGIV